jgi:hypothetical protein
VKLGEAVLFHFAMTFLHSSQVASSAIPCWESVNSFGINRPTLRAGKVVVAFAGFPNVNHLHPETAPQSN